MLRIAFDLDGTLADLDAALDRVAEQLFPRGVRDDRATAAPVEPRPANAGEGSDADRVTEEEEQLEPPEVRALTRRQQHAIWDAVRATTDFWETLDEIEPGIVSRLAATAEARRWEVIFITQRPASDGQTTQRQSQRWLAKHGFELPSVYVLGPGASRGKVAAALSLDVMVDDRPENCLDVKVDSQARAILVARQSTAAIAENAARHGIEVVSSVGECLARLAPAHAGLLGRLKKMIGVERG